jgi:hypothetical protein
VQFVTALSNVSTRNRQQSLTTTTSIEVLVWYVASQRLFEAEHAVVTFMLGFRQPINQKRARKAIELKRIDVPRGG